MLSPQVNYEHYAALIKSPGVVLRKECRFVFCGVRLSQCFSFPKSSSLLLHTLPGPHDVFKVKGNRR